MALEFLLLQDGLTLRLNDAVGSLLLASSGEAETPTETRMLCARMTVTPRMGGSPSISPAINASGVSASPSLTGTVTIERC